MNLFIRLTTQLRDRNGHCHFHKNSTVPVTDAKDARAFCDLINNSTGTGDDDRTERRAEVFGRISSPGGRFTFPIDALSGIISDLCHFRTELRSPRPKQSLTEARDARVVRLAGNGGQVNDGDHDFVAGEV